MKRWISVLAPSFALIVGLLLTAQTPTPFPQTLPSNTVVGRLGSGVAGPAEAITFTTLSTAMFPGGLALPPIAASSILANPTGGSAVPQATTVGASLAFTGTVLGTVAVTGDVTAAANSFATTIPANTVTNAKAAQMAAFTLKGNATGSTANATDFLISGLTSKPSPAAGDLLIISDESASHALKSVPISAVSSAGSVSSIDAKTGAFTTGNGLDTATNLIELTAARRTLPTYQKFTTGTNATYTRPANVLWIKITIVGPGGGGAGGGTGAPTNGGAGSSPTCWNTAGTACTTPVFSAGAGSGGDVVTTGNGGAGGAVAGSTACTIISVAGRAGGAFGGANAGAEGGSSTLGGAGAGVYQGAGAAAATNSGSGGQGGANTGAATNLSAGPGGGAGATCVTSINTPAASYTYTIGTGGAAGTAGTNGTAGGAGAAGYILVEEHYGT